MAAATIESELAVVNVIRAVAVAAAVAQRQLHLEWLAVEAIDAAGEVTAG